MRTLFLKRFSSCLVLSVLLSGIVIGDSTPRAAKNSWRGLVPLHSSVEEVAQVLGVDAGEFNLDSGNTFKVNGGDVTVSFISPRQAKLYSAPRSFVGRVFTIYFKPDSPVFLSELNLPRGFRKCSDDLSKAFYYFVSEEGLAYQFRAGSERVESVIYQPMKIEIRRLSVATDCVF